MNEALVTAERQTCVLISFILTHIPSLVAIHIRGLCVLRVYPSVLETSERFEFHCFRKRLKKVSETCWGLFGDGNGLSHRQRRVVLSYIYSSTFTQPT